MAKCVGFKENGEKCEAHAIRDGKFCFFHSKKNMEAPKSISTLSEIKTDSIEGLAQFISELMKQLADGRVDVKRANSLGYLTNVLHRILIDSSIEQRITALEERIGGETDAK